MAHNLHDEINALAKNQHKPEAVSVAVVVPDHIECTDGIVRSVAKMVAESLHEGMRFGAVLHVEQVAERQFEVAVEVIGTPFSAVTVGTPMAAVL